MDFFGRIVMGIIEIISISKLTFIEGSRFIIF